MIDNISISICYYLYEDISKNGDASDPVVVRDASGTAMPGGGETLGPESVRAVTAYVYHLAGYHLAGRDVPRALRAP